MMSTSSLGKIGEEKAAAFLEKKGMIVLARNYRSPFGEIDLICRDSDQIVFVEVKSRASLAFGDGAEAVDRRKIEKIIRGAQFFLKGKRLENASFRFDVVSILSGPGERITHIPGAFP